MSQIEEYGWDLEKHPQRAILPSYAYSNALNVHCATQPPPDEGFTFSFPNTEQTVQIHASRLTFVDGPLNALATKDFRERSQRVVNLSDEDSPSTFNVLRDFLYCKEISLQELDVAEILAVIKAAHRWGLMPLFQVLCFLVEEANLLSTAADLIVAADVIMIPEVPKGFGDYFWKAVAVHYDEFSPRPLEKKDCESAGSDTEEESGDHADPEPSESRDSQQIATGDSGERNDRDKSQDSIKEAASSCSSLTKACYDDHQDDVSSTEGEPEEAWPARLSPLFPTLWELAVAQGTVCQLMKGIQAHSSTDWSKDFMRLVLYYIEPRVKDDDAIFELFELLGPKSFRQECLLSPGEMEGCSGRAVQLLSKSVIASTKIEDVMQYSWDVNLRQIKPCRRVFLFGHSTSTNYNYGYSENAWEVGPFNGNAAIQISVETSVRDFCRLQVSVKWTVGPCVSTEERELEACLRLLPNPCECDDRNALKQKQDSDALSKWVFTSPLKDKYVAHQVIYRDDKVQNLRSPTGMCMECTAKATITVRMRKL